MRDAAFAGNLASVTPFAAARSSIAKLKGVKTPVFLMQGRRDFAFGLDQALTAYRALAGPKQLWIGLNGHAPSSGLAADTPAMLAASAQWFDRYLRGDTSTPLAKPVAVSPERWRGQPVRFAGLPKVVVRGSPPVPDAGCERDRAGRAATGSRSRASPVRPRSSAPRPCRSPRTRAVAGRVSSPCSAPGRPPARRSSSRREACRPGRAGGRYRIALNDQATFLPRGSRLTLTLGSSSLAQSPANLLYLDLPLAPTARLAVTSGSVALPALATPVSR